MCTNSLSSITCSVQVKGHQILLCGRFRKRKAKMVKWEYQVGPVTFNFRVLLEPKGFLRIIIAVSDLY